MEKVFIDTADQDSLIRNQNNNTFDVKFNGQQFDRIQLEQMMFQNWFCNISFDRDFSYTLNGVNVSLQLPIIYYTQQILFQLLEDEGFDAINYDSSQKKIGPITHSSGNGWAPRGAAWVHLGFPEKDLQQQLPEATQFVPPGPLNIQYGVFYLVIKDFIANDNITFLIPAFGGHGEQIYVQKQEGMYSLITPRKKLQNTQIRILDRFKQPVRTTFDPTFTMQIVMQLQTIKE